MNIESNGLQNKINYQFRDKSLLTQALTHSSYANEMGYSHQESNERLEFLGDAVLELVSSEYLYAKFPNLNEGELSKKRARMVCEQALDSLARKIGLEEYILLGKGEEKCGGRSRPSIVSDALEAVIGAVFLDAGMDTAKTFVLERILKDIDQTDSFYDNKTALQEYLQAMAKSPLYTLVGEEGPSHQKLFSVEVSLEGRVLGAGRGSSKKAAEQMAAKEALHILKKNG